VIWRAPPKSRVYLVSFLFRYGSKALCDFTGGIVFRASSSIGGRLFTCNMIKQVLLLPASLFAFQLVKEIPAANLPWRLVWVLLVVWSANFLILLAIMKPEYTRSFFSSETGAERVRALFLDANDVERETHIADATKAAIIMKPQVLWAPIRDDVKEWILANYSNWEMERPGWFTDAWKAALDDDMIPQLELRELVASGQRALTVKAKRIVKGSEPQASYRRSPKSSRRIYSEISE
jgi:hypothetical protein